MGSKQKWTIQEDDILKKLVTQGLSDTEIGILMGRSKHSIMHRRKYTLGIDMCLQWTPNEDARLARLLAQGKSLSEIGKLLNRTESAVQGRKQRLGIKTAPIKLSKHNPADIAQLVKFKMMGWSHDAIAQVFDITAAYVSQLLTANGFKRFCAVAVSHTTYRLWTEIELHSLRKCLVRGISLNQIYLEFPYRSQCAICKKIKQITRYWITPQEQAKRNEMRHQRLGVGMAKLTKEI